MNPRGLLFFLVLLGMPGAAWAEDAATEVQYLSGVDKDHPVEWEFFCTEGRWCGFPTVIPVPSQWELMGFGRYDYGFQKRKHPEEGRYRHRFLVPAAWRDRQVDLVFGGVMTDAEVRLNGQSVGPVHQGGFTEFRYDVTDLLVFSESNLLEVTVREASSNPSVNRAERDADYWLFGGIYRPVSLEARPRRGIRRLAVDADADGSLTVEVRLIGKDQTGKDQTGKDQRVTARLFEWDEEEGASLGEPLVAPVAAGTETVLLAGRFPTIESWTAETPHLYRLEVILEGPQGVLHRVEERIGFRTVEVRTGLGIEENGLYLNGRRIRLKGINRHSFWPDSGRATTRTVSELDARLIRQMNLNAVRTSHYPPDPHFLEVCDEVGLYVLLELPGWHDAYDTEVGTPLVEEMVTRDVNHPSVILWSNGNEGGWNAKLDPLFDRFDPQDRPLLHPDSDKPFRGLNTLHYRNYKELREILYHEGFGGWWAGWWGEPDLYLTTEFLHGLYDGGHGAGLRDFWDAIRGAPNGVGGFLWAYVDEGVLRTDQARTDQEGVIDTYTNYAPDGVVGPYREKEGSFYTLRRIFSPVQLKLPERLPRDFDGRVEIKNEYHFTDLAGLNFHWRLLRLPNSDTLGSASHGTDALPCAEALASGEATVALSVPPGVRSLLDLRLPTGLGADTLEIVAVDSRGEAVNEWVLPLGEKPSLEKGTSRATCRQEGDRLLLSNPGETTEVTLDAASGELIAWHRQGCFLPLTAGPRFGPTPARAADVRCDGAGGVMVRDAGPLQEARWRLLEDGILELTYRYRSIGLGSVHGPGFDLPREGVRAMHWRGRGPYRVWANRLEGPLYGVWSLTVNDTRSGAEWQYPEFSGFFADPEWVAWEGPEGRLTVQVEGPAFFQNFHPGTPEDPRFTVTPLHPSAVAFLHAIPGIGTKFHPPEDLGPMGQGESGGEFQGTLRFHFSAASPAAVDTPPTGNCSGDSSPRIAAGRGCP